MICPGTIETPILGDITPELKAYCESQTPLARLGKPLNIRAIAVHLSRPESSFITGQVIAIDCGWTAQWFCSYARTACHPVFGWHAVR